MSDTEPSLMTVQVSTSKLIQSSQSKMNVSQTVADSHQWVQLYGCHRFWPGIIVIKEDQNLKVRIPYFNAEYIKCLSFLLDIL